MITNLVIQFTNVAFAAVLETATDPAGPWTEAQESFSACPQLHTFNVPVTTNAMFAAASIDPTNSIPGGGTNMAFESSARFFRGKFLDNGVEPTPQNVYAQRWTATSIAVSATMQFRCDDSQAGPTEFWRSTNGVNFTLVHTALVPSFIDTNLAPGTYTYKGRISGGLFSEVQPEVTLP
jgi:hypothetical protein